MENITSLAAGGASAAIIAVLVFIWQNNLFVRPEHLERKHREVLDDCDKRYANKETVEELKQDVREIKQDIKDMKGIIIDFISKQLKK